MYCIVELDGSVSAVVGGKGLSLSGAKEVRCFIRELMDVLFELKRLGYEEGAYERSNSAHQNGPDR